MSDMDEYKKERQALLEARKIKATVPDSELEKHSDADMRIVPKTFKEKWANYWYHYKGVTFGTTAAVIMIFSFVWSVTHPTVYDTTISFVSTVPFESIAEPIQAAMETYVEDYTGDGEKKVELAYYTMTDPNNTEALVNGQAEMAVQMKMTARLSTGEDFLFVVDDMGYMKLTEHLGLAFEDLSVYTDSPNVQGDKYQINGTNLLKTMGMEGWESNLYICFVDFSIYGEKKQSDKDLVQIHENATKVLENLLAVS